MNTKLQSLMPILKLTSFVAFAMTDVLGMIGPDTLCTVRHGNCQLDSNPCTGGTYLTGICSGATNRRCCVKCTSAQTFSSANIVSRDGWGAQPSKSKTYVQNPLEMFFIHHTDTPECNQILNCSACWCPTRLISIQNYHMNTRGWSDIGYNFLIGGDGNIYEGRGWDIVGAHTAGYNSKGYAAAFIGDFTSHLPTSAALQAAKDLISCGVKLGKLSSNYTLYGHRQVGSTTCPGDTLYADIQKWPHWTTGHP